MAIIDSGADNSIFPTDILTDIGAPRLRQAKMSGIHGISQNVDLYLVSINIGAIKVRGIRAIAGGQSREAIIGRDVLNQLVVTLDGLAEVTEMTD